MVKAPVRRKRASADDLYRSCRLGGDCIPDVVNKQEQNTLADRLLKWFSSFLYFGTLGIGTGKGTGGQGGYTRLGGGVTGGRGPNVARPNVIVDALGPSITPIDPVNPDSAIIPLLEDTGSTSIGGGEVEVIAEVHPPPTNGGGPVLIDQPGEPPVLEVTPEPHPTPRTRTTVSRHNNPAFNAFVSSTQLPAETSATDNIYILHGFGGEIVGGETSGEFEEIPLTEFNTSSTEPKTSTPNTSFRQILNKFERRLYNRKLVQQVKITDRRFLTQPSQLVQWEFDNPAYDDTVSLLFEQEVSNVQAAPAEEFTDVIRLSKPILSEREGYVRVSRLGKKGTIKTRSGIQIGGHMHYYTDLSSINPTEDVEMQILGQHSNESAIVQPLAESTLINSDFDLAVVFGPEEEPLIPDTDLFSEDTLLDDYEEDFARSRLEVTGGRNSRILTISDSLPPGSAKLFVEDIGSIVTHRDKDPRQPDIIYPDVYPPVIIDFGTSGATFYLHPSLFLRRKRRKRRFL
ncbi:L2 protein [Cervus elaphus papillomavirus 2]|uniref:Minor capsid protein L2 n=1 Tax=Cervus elaphus papillomavirus 2 TaxID=1747359 RepID=A0A1I9KHZ6_9PAPI|nr:L2 protein [Cervus elaphus papillomavirus 2]ALP46949.1 L2 protein [Cervus elaphus papillomavirus 2]